MLVLLGPPFDGTELQYAQLAQLTGLVIYDLKTKLKPGAWGLVRVLADVQQAQDLSSRLRTGGFTTALVDQDTAHDVQRQFISLRSIELGAEEMILHLRERSMPVPYQSLLTIVRGEVQLGRSYGRTGGSTSSSGLRAVAPTAADMAVVRESMASASLDAFAAADLHFASELWSARIDARHFDFSLVGERSESAVQDLDRLVDGLASRAGVRVDRSLRISSVASFAARPPPMRSATPPPGSTPNRGRDGLSDERFDAYSRLVAEAERQVRGR
jgi:hypothetical protein